MKFCLNGHEWLKRRGIPFEPLDNGIQSSAEAAWVQRIADTPDSAKIDAVFRKWLRRLPHPFAPRHRGVRAHVAQLLGRGPAAYAVGAMMYDLRRLRLHGLIERVPDSHRYRITERGASTAMLYVRLYARALRPVASLHPSGSARGRQTFVRLDAALANFLQEVHLAA